jgi:hypothetical protein
VGLVGIRGIGRSDMGHLGGLGENRRRPAWTSSVAREMTQRKTANLARKAPVFSGAPYHDPFRPAQIGPSRSDLTMAKGDAERADLPGWRSVRGTKWDYLVGFTGFWESHLSRGVLEAAATGLDHAPHPVAGGPSVGRAPRYVLLARPRGGGLALGDRQGELDLQLLGKFRCHGTD